MHDSELINAFLKEKSQAAFADLVARHVNMVYAAALRQIGDRQLAEDIVQGVFLALSEKLPELGAETALAPWLYTATRYACVNMLRTRARQKRTDAKAGQMSTSFNGTEDEKHQWFAVQPILDEAMESIGATDRAVIVMRFFEQRQLKEIGTQIGTSESGAEKRVTRALEKLRRIFARRGITVSALGVAALFSTHGVHAAPAGLTAIIVKSFAEYSAGFHLTTGKLIAKGLLKTMFVAKTLKLAAVAAIFLLLGCAGTAVVDRIIYSNTANADAAQLAAKVDALEKQIDVLKTQAQQQAQKSALGDAPAFAENARPIAAPIPEVPGRARPIPGRGAPVANLPPPDITKRLIVHLPMQGDLSDQGPSHYPVRNIGNVTVDASMAGFNGASWLELPFVPLDEREFAVAVWIKPSVASATGYGLVTQNTENIQSQLLHLILGPEMEPHLSFYENHLTSSVQYKVLPNTWTHLVFQYFDKKQHIYMNGQLIAERWAGPYEGTHGSTFIGRPPQWFDHPIANYTGWMTDFRIYDGRLSPAQMQVLVQTPPQKGPGVPEGATDKKEAADAF